MRVWCQRSIFPQVCGWPGELFFWVMPRAQSSFWKPLGGAAAVGRAGEPGGEHQAVVGQDAGGWSVLVAGLTEGVDDAGAGDGPVGGRGDQVAGVVVEEGQHFGVGAVGEADVGEVGLPHLVGQVGLEGAQ